MSNDPYNDDPVTHDELPLPGETDPVDELPTDDDELLAAAEDQLIDDGTEAMDLSVDDRVQDGAAVEDLEPSNVGRREMEADFEHPEHEDTIDERIRQEIPEEGSSIVPPR